MKMVTNPETVEAMKAARQGEVIAVGKPESLLASLRTIYGSARVSTDGQSVDAQA